MNADWWKDEPDDGPELEKAFEDAQHGIRGVLNNIPGLIAMLGGGAGLAGSLDQPRSKSGKQLAEEFMARMEARMRAYEIRGDNLILDPDDEDYEIPLVSCSTHAQIVAWIMHLSEKTWFDQEMLRTFISAACDHHGLDPRTKI